MAEQVSPIPGIKFILGGAAGAGKTSALKTLIGQIPNVRALFVDPNYSSAVEGTTGIKDFRYINPYGSSWDVLSRNANMVNTMTNAALQELKSGMNNAEYRQFIDILSCCNNFKTQDGLAFGDIASWGTDTVLCIDGLSGLSKASATLVVGAKPVRTQTDWGVMMANLENFLETIAGACWCHVVLIAHLEPEMDEYTGRIMRTVSTLGRKLAPNIPKNWTDLVVAKLEAGKFSWDTADPQVAIKSMHLPLQSGLQPSFVQVIERWKARGGIISSARPAVGPAS